MSLLIIRKNPDEWVIPAYAPAPFTPVQGESSRLWDQQSKEYTNFVGGIAVNVLSHAHPALHEALNDQASKFWRMGNGYTNKPVLHLAKKLIDATFAERIFFRNSGAEANEATLKLACRYAHDRFGSQKSGIVAFKSAFYGRILFTVSAGGQPAYSQGFAPLPPNTRYAVYSDLDSASQLIDDTTRAVIMEPVRGEGGVVPTTKAFSRGLRELCNRHNALLISDEVRAGVGRAGELCTYMHYGMTSDLLTAAKALGDDFSIGALLVAERCAGVMTVGTHSTTYDGSPLAAAVAGKSLEIVNTPEVFGGVKQRHDWFAERINAINERFGLFSKTRGLGLLIGCVPNAGFARKAKFIPQEAAAVGVMVLIAGANVMCFAPALSVSEKGIATGLDRFALAYGRIKAGGSPWW